MLLSRGISQSAGVNFSNCFKLVDQTTFRQIVKVAFQKNCPRSTRSFPRCSASICFPGNEIPEWFIIQSTGSSLTFELKAYPTSAALNDLILCTIVEFQNYHSEDQSLVISCEYTISIRKSYGRVPPFRGNMRVWDFGPGLGYVDSDHVFLGYDFPRKFDELGIRGYLMMTIQFYVENLDTKSNCCCKVTKCGAWSPSLQWMTSEKDQLSKRLKISNFLEGESSSR
ncbi:disease resistance protein RPS4B-like [Pistacia vera]|uniref:disease resistance protein RPS4B-like n=1 Tax=Pistacia vera TaxID=55513 RepID=UPI00126324D6|nr:disease resistance protein RPS4B-like [Pistacia vera]